MNHRFGLDDGVLIKDNHIAAAGGILEAIDRARAGIGHMTKLEVEVDTLDQLRLALTRPLDAVLLDNMAPPTLREAVAVVAGRALTEASGGITPANLPDVAATGVDIVSLGWLTHSGSGPRPRPRPRAALSSLAGGTGLASRQARDWRNPGCPSLSARHW
jgi:nicotinate-nucleotide pyrophosphorylase (carboxylating)